jgi:AcrR family transcriptional regulator
MTDTLDQATETPETKERLLAAAEKLFAEHGIERASLRAITEEAQANLAAVHYHFGSKEGLVRAVFSRRLEPLNRERLDLLARCTADDGEAPTLDCIVHAFVAPVLRMIRDSEEGQNLACLVGRIFYQPDDELRSLIFEEFREVRDLFTSALSRALPFLSTEEVYWRFHFMVGSMAHTAATGSLIEQVSDGRCSLSDIDLVTRHLVAFIVAGLAAPATEATEAGR